MSFLTNIRRFNQTIVLHFNFLILLVLGFCFLFVYLFVFCCLFVCLFVFVRVTVISGSLIQRLSEAPLATRNPVGAFNLAGRCNIAILLLLKFLPQRSNTVKERERL